MNTKQSRLHQLRQRAEQALNTMSDLNIQTTDINELIHELHVYHTELELQLEDLTQAYEQVELSQERYANLFNFAPVGYVVTDLDGIILNTNLRFSAMVTMNQAETQGLSFSELITRDFQDTYHLHRRTISITQQTAECEVQIHRADGTIFNARLLSQLRDSDPQTLQTALIDITTVKQTQQALQQALAHEKQTSQLRQRVLSVLAHEFRTPLTTMLTSVTMLEKYYEKMTAEQRQRHYKTMHNLIWYLNDTVQDIGTIHENNDDLPLMNPKNFDIFSFVPHLITDIRTMVTNNHVIIFHDDGCQETELVTWDRHLIRRILINLIGNAVKYSQADVTCHMICQGETIIFKIEDHGVGISEEDISHMYEAFYRGDAGEFIVGTGIGLYIVLQSVKAHGGTIRCESVLEQGTTFTVELPRDVVLPD